MKLLQSTTILNKEIIMKCLVIKIPKWRFLQLPTQKNLIAALRIVTIEKPE